METDIKKIIRSHILFSIPGRPAYKLNAVKDYGNQQS